MIGLLAREWRENRALILGLVILAPLASIGTKLLLPGGEIWDERLSAGGLLPVLLLIYSVSIASDLISGDVGSGRITLLASLPVRPATVWGAKALFLFGGSLAYFAYILVIESALLSAMHLGGTLFTLGDLADFWRHILPVPVIAASVLFYSTIVSRGIAAALCGMVTIAALGSVVFLHPDPKRVGLPLLVGTGALLMAAFLLGSFVAFTRGRVHLGARTRPLALAVGVLLVVFGAPAAWSGVRIHRWMNIRWSDDDLRSRRVWKVRDGMMVSGVSRKTGRCFGIARPCEVVLVDLDDGKVSRLGTYVLGNRYFPSGWEIRRFVNGSEMRYHGANRWMVTRPGREPIVLPPEVQVGWTANDWCVTVSGGGLLDLESGRILSVPKAPDGTAEHMILAPPSAEGFGFVQTHDRGLYKITLDGRVRESVLDERIDRWRTSPNGRHTLFRTADAFYLLRAKDAQLIPLPELTRTWRSAQIVWSEYGSAFVFRGLNHLWLCDSIEESPRLRPLPIPNDMGEVAWFDGKQILLEDGERIRIATLDGQTRQLLPPKENP